MIYFNKNLIKWLVVLIFFQKLKIGQSIPLDCLRVQLQITHRQKSPAKMSHFHIYFQKSARLKDHHAIAIFAWAFLSC